MTTPSPAATDREFTPLGHPVRNASVALALVVILLVLAWAAGLFTPRAATTSISGSYDLATRRGTFVTDLRNDGLLGFEVHGATIVAGDVHVVDASLAGTPLDEHPTLSSEETQPLVLRYEVTDCGATPRSDWRLEVEVRTPLGLTRRSTLDIGLPGAAGLCL